MNVHITQYAPIMMPLPLSLVPKPLIPLALVCLHQLILKYVLGSTVTIYF